MKLTIELTDDDAALQMYLMAEGMWHTLWKYDQWLRGEIKHGESSEIARDETMDEIRQKLHDMMQENGVDLEKIQ